MDRPASGEVPGHRAAGGAPPHRRPRLRRRPLPDELRGRGDRLRLLALRGSRRAPQADRRRRRAAAGGDHDDRASPTTTCRPAAYDRTARLEDMDDNWMEASLCFPTFPRFCGQTFLEAKDNELALLCVRAYNDWMVEEWCGDTGGRLIPLTPDPAVGRTGRGRRGAAQRGPRRAGRVLQRDPGAPRTAERARPRRLLGPVLRRLRRDRHRRQHAHRLVLEDAVHVAPTPPLRSRPR